MPRPLVWVGVAYTFGAIWAVNDKKLFYGIAGMLFVMWITGRIRQSWIRLGLFWLLPVFFVSGFVVTMRAVQKTADATMADQWVQVTGTVSKKEEKENSLAVTVSNVRLDGTKKRILLYIEKEQEGLMVGDTIEVAGTFQKPEKAGNPGQFDAYRYYLSKGISYLLWPEKWQVIRKGNRGRQALQWVRDFWMKRYGLFLDEEDAGVVRAVLVGDKSSMDEETETLYIQAGIVHILAISGLHISIIGMSVFQLLKRMGAGLKGSACLSAGIVFCYGMMTGMGPSTERAVIMFLVRMGAVYLGCNYDFLSAVSLAALILFISQPFVILQSGVWFSFAAVLSIGVLWPAIEKVLPWQYEKAPNQKVQILKKRMGIHPTKREYFEKIARYAGPSLAVTIGTLPLTAYSYGAIPLISFWLNLIVVPLMSIFVPVAIIAGAISLLSENLAIFFGGSLHFILQMNRWLCEKMLRLPFSVWRTGVLPVTWIVIYYGILIVLIILSLVEEEQWRSWRYGNWLKKRRWMTLLLCLFVMIPVRRWQPMVAFLDVGQGDGIFMRTPNGTTWLVDGGSSDVKELGKYRLLPFLNYYGENTVDYACVTHSDSDHISGIQELIQTHQIRHLVLTEISKKDIASCELAQLAKENGIEVLFIRQGSRWESGGWQFSCIYPGETVPTDNVNDQSMVLRIQAGNQSFLMTGDITAEAEKEMTAQKLQDVDVLKVAHHGSKYSSSTDFLKCLHAKTAIISCGKENRYGHPAPETLSRLQQENTQVYMTMDQGAVIMTYKNGRFLLRTWLK